MSGGSLADSDSSVDYDSLQRLIIRKAAPSEESVQSGAGLASRAIGSMSAIEIPSYESEGCDRELVEMCTSPNSLLGSYVELGGVRNAEVQ